MPEKHPCCLRSGRYFPAVCVAVVREGISFCRRKCAVRMLSYLEVEMPADRGSLTLRFTAMREVGGPEHTTTHPCSRQDAGIL